MNYSDIAAVCGIVSLVVGIVCYTLGEAKGRRDERERWVRGAAR